jgi:lysyl-tRNA synthetase class 2
VDLVNSAAGVHVGLPVRKSRFSPRTRARILGCFVALVGLVDVGSSVLPAIDHRFDAVANFITPTVRNTAAGATALVGLALLVVGRGLAHRRMVAYRLAVGLLFVTVVTHIVKGLDFEEAVLAIVAAVALLRQRQLFTVPVAPARWRRLATMVPVVVAGMFAYGIAGLVLRRGNVAGPLTPANALQEVAARLVGLSGRLELHGRFGHWFPASITAVGIAGVVLLLLAVLAPVAERAVADTIQRDRVRHLLDRPDGDTLDPFALRHDKHYVFSPDGRAAVAYRYVRGVGLMSGDPVGEPDAFAPAFAAFVDLCDAQGWRLAVLGARRDRAEVYASARLRDLYLGDEAIIDTATFTLDGRDMRPVRQATNRTINHGITVEFHREGELDPTLRRALIGIADRHRGDNAERGFSMALDGLLEGRHPDALVTVARDAAGAPFAFQRYIPCRAGRALSLDTMRRDNVGVNGVNERMIVESVQWAAANGVDEVSLNFAVARELLCEGAELSTGEAAEAWVLRRLGPYFQIESLLSFNAKFHPRWVPRSLLFCSLADVVPVAVAALSAEAFLPLDPNRDLPPSDAEEEIAVPVCESGISARGAAVDAAHGREHEAGRVELEHKR